MSKDHAKKSSTSRYRRKLARQKAHADYSEQAHPRRGLAETVDLERIEQLIRPVLASFDLVLEEVTARGAGNGQTLAVVVDLPEDAEGSVSLDTLGEVSQAVSAALDADPEEPETAYLLEVTSPGATRKLMQTRHWKRARGRLLRITPQEGEAFLARLDAVEEGADGVRALIRRRKNTRKGQPESYHEQEALDPASVRKAQVEVEFSGPADAE